MDTVSDVDPDTGQLLDLMVAGDESAAQRLLERHRERLRRLVATHLDPRVSARIDPSDVIQEALAEAYQRLPQYADQRPVSFYPWLRSIAWQRLVKLHRTHVVAARRSVHREDAPRMDLPDASAQRLAEQLAAGGTEPSQKVVKQEIRQRVRTALDELPPADRAVLVMRYLEHMSMREIGEALETTTAAVKMRHARALQRLESTLRDTQ
ncbi:MAG: sigma-70 family RNA polymerase sigma factor [Planctomycetota bacterium]